MANANLTRAKIPHGMTRKFFRCESELGDSPVQCYLMAEAPGGYAPKKIRRMAVGFNFHSSDWLADTKRHAYAEFLHVIRLPKRPTSMPVCFGPHFCQRPGDSVDVVVRDRAASYDKVMTFGEAREYCSAAIGRASA